MRAEIAGAVLCGGGSRRMGPGADKATVLVDGERLVDRAVRRLSSIATPVIVAPGRTGRIDALSPVVIEVDDAVEDSGPLGGLVAVLAVSPAPITAVVGVDMVDFDTALLQWLAEQSASAGATAVVPTDDTGRPQPLHAVYASTALPALRSNLDDGRLAMRDALVAIGALVVASPRELGFAWARNVNRPDD